MNIYTILCAKRNKLLGPVSGGGMGVEGTEYLGGEKQITGRIPGTR
jgi:hypothetical protein